MHYEEADDELFETFEAEAQEFLSTIGRTEFKHTYRALFGFIFKTNALKTGIFDAVDSENPYVLRILFRCLCEHYLKFTHIHMRFAEEKTDQVGIDFFSFCGAVEAREYAKSLRLAESLIGNDFALDLDRLVARLYPNAAECSVRQLEERSSEFRYREILKSLARRGPQFISADTSFLASIIPAYAELSSFIHGGPAADDAMTMFGSNEEKEDCREKAGLAFSMVGSIYAFTSLVVAAEFNEYMPLATKLNGILRKYLNNDDPDRSAT